MFALSFVWLTSTNPGFSIEHVQTGDVALSMARYQEPARRAQFVDDLTRDLPAVPGVRAVGFVSHIPLRNRFGNLHTRSADNASVGPSQRPGRSGPVTTHTMRSRWCHRAIRQATAGDGLSDAGPTPAVSTT